LNALAAACRRWPRAEKWVLMPSLGEGLTLGDRLAEAGVAWANLRFTSPRTLARQLAGAVLAAEGWRALPWGGGQALVARVLAGLPASVPRYFREESGQGPADALWRTIQELRLAGVTAEVVPGAVASTPAKAAELAALLAAVDRELRESRIADAAITLERATLEAARWNGSRILLIAARHPWTPLESRLIEAIPGARHPLPDVDLPGAAAAEAAPRRLSDTPGAPPEPGAPLAWLLAPDAAHPGVPRERIEVVRAAGHEAEINAAIAALLASGLGADRFEISCAQDRPYLGAIRDTCERLGLEVTIGPGLPAAQTRPGRLALALARWALSDFPASTLRAILLSGDLEQDAGESGRMAHHLAAAGAGWTKGTYRSSLTALARYYRGAYGPDDETPPAREGRAREAERTLATIRGWLETFPEPDAAGLIGVVAFTAALERLLERARAQDDFDRRARAMLRERLAALREAAHAGEYPSHPGAGRQTPQALLAQIEDLLAGSLGAARPRPGALHVSVLRDAALSGRERLLVVGFDQAAPPRPLIQDPVLLDREREHLARLTGIALPTASDRTRESLYRILARLGSSDARITLSYSFRDTRDNKAAFAHRLLLQAQRLVAGEPDLSYEAMERSILAVTPVPARPSDATDDLRWWLAGLRGLPLDGTGAVLDSFPGLKAGTARTARIAHFLDPSRPPPQEPDELDGLVPEAVVEDPRRSGRPISPTALATLAACRRRYFLDRILGVDPTTTRERDPSAWLDPLQRGSFLHAFYERVHRQGIAGEAGARQVFDELLAELRAEFPPPGPGSEAIETAELWEDAVLFVANHGAARGVEAEVAFGMDGPLTIPTSAGPLPVRGQIDRLDDLGGQRYRVVDYKTGRFPGTAQFGKRLEKGAYLQHLVYPLALAALRPGARAEEFRYVFPTRAGENESFAWQPDPERDASAIEGWLSRLEHGLFLPTVEEATCEFCDFRAACEAAPWQAGARMKDLEAAAVSGDAS
jgi:ATP-dependent helicase/nuclease subunit B